MGSNVNSNSEMGSPDVRHEEQVQPAQDDQGPQRAALISQPLKPHPDRIEFCVRDDDASDTLRDGSLTQTPNDEELSRDTEEIQTTTSSDSAKAFVDEIAGVASRRDGQSHKSPLGDDVSETDDNSVIRVKESEDENSESIEIELEDDNCLLLTSLTSLFPDATGLKFRNPKSNTMRGIKLVDGKFVEPNNGWASVRNYICVFSRGGVKRKLEGDVDKDGNKRIKADPERSETVEGSDLIIPNLASNTTEDNLRGYFEQYCEVSMVQVKADSNCAMSGGYGIVRLAKQGAQNEIMSKRHLIDGKWCDVLVLRDKVGSEATNSTQVSRRVFVSRLPENTTREDLMSYFSQYGTITDIFIPRLFRNFAFVTFETLDMVKSLFKNKHEHKINGTLIQISEAIPKINNLNNYGPNGGGGVGGFNGGPQQPSGCFGGGYVGSTSSNIHTFGPGYGSPRSYHHHHRKGNLAGNSVSGGGPYGGSRKMHQRPSYEQMHPYGSSGPGGGIDPASYASQTYYEALALAASGCNQPLAGVNGGQYFKMQQQQQQPVVTSNQNHGAYPSPSSYSNHEGSRGS